MSAIEEAAEWFVAMRDDGGSATQRARFSEWLLQSPEHVRIYLELTPIWAEAAGLDPNPLDARTLIARARTESNVVALEGLSGAKVSAVDVPSTAAVEAAPAAVSRSSSATSPVRRYVLAASVAAAAIVGVLWAITRPTVYATGIGEQRSIALIDGSRIELNARSRMQVRFSGEERAIELIEGQGLFKVAKDPRRPFVVTSGGTRVRAVGTEFDVYRKPGGTVVTVVEGRVEIGTGSPVQLAAGEQAIVAPNEIARQEKPNIEAATAWTQRQLVFNAASLVEVAAEFNRYNFKRLVVEDAQLRQFPISGVFSSSDPSSLVQFLMEQPEIAVEQTDSEVIIARKMR